MGGIGGGEGRVEVMWKRWGGEVEGRRVGNGSSVDERGGWRRWRVRAERNG